MSKTLLFALSMTVGAVACLYFSGELHFEGLEALLYLVRK